jgi:hypothetical protein
MSADNWASCPRCAARDAKLGPYPTTPTFREDYEFYGGETGTLEISYHGQCTDCGLTLHVSEKREFWTPAEPELYTEGHLVKPHARAMRDLLALERGRHVRRLPKSRPVRWELT